MFVNLSEGFEDGVREEVLAHLNVVIPNIQIIKIKSLISVMALMIY